MASVVKQLTKDWIQYLKNNQIAGMQSNPKTGRLDYKREPTVTDLVTYLSKDYDEDAILDAIQTALTQPASGEEGEGGELATQGSRDPSTWHNSEVSPADPQDQIGNNPTQAPRDKKYNNDDAEDAKYSQRGVVPRNGSRDPSTWHNSEVTPNGQDQIGAQMPWRDKPKKYSNDNAQDVEVKNKDPKQIGKAQSALSPPAKGPSPDPKSPPSRKPRFKYRHKKGHLKEAIRDWQGEELSEKEIQQVFKILAEPETNKTKVQGTQDQVPNTVNTGVPDVNMEEQVRKLKRVIRDTMTAEQRQALYRALTDV